VLLFLYHEGMRYAFRWAAGHARIGGFFEGHLGMRREWWARMLWILDGFNRWCEKGLC
jgi:hypothetical protein